jgi:mono/diheme cytochrome c family protein
MQRALRSLTLTTSLGRNLTRMFFFCLWGLSHLSYLSYFSYLCSSSGSASVEEPVLNLTSPEKTLTFTRSQLLSHPALTAIEVTGDPTYPDSKRHYQAVPAAALFQSLKISAEATIQFTCRDGFSAPISRQHLLNQKTSGAIAYIAIEEANKPWPAIRPPTKPYSAGPFYLVWVNPKASGIGREEWPFQLTGFEIAKSMRELYPAIFPDSKLAGDHPVVRGFKIFSKTCFTCHTLNKQGRSEIGPDLNWPMNPTEYFQLVSLKALIRDPQKLRSWPQSKMKGFSKEEVSDAELADLVQYLKHMAKRKQGGRS